MLQSREEMQLEALDRARNGQSLGNWPAIVRGFIAKGIPEDQIIPRVNVLTYNAWRAAGRQVRRGEHGVKVVTFIPTWDKSQAPHNDVDGSLPERDRKRGKNRPWSATVFHISQTDPIGREQPRRYSEATPDPVDLAYEDAGARACGL